MWVAAGGDLHFAPATKVAAMQAELRAAASAADIVLLAGDLTATGRPEEAASLAEVCADMGAPVVCVLGNHDRRWEGGTAVAAALAEAGAVVLDPGAHVVEVAGTRIGIAGVTGAPGGFAGRAAWGMGRKADKQWRRAAAAEAKELDAALASLQGCSIRIALLHYAPTFETLEGEEPYLWPALGSDQLAVPIQRHRPHLVLHAHAHEGSPQGQIAGIPVLNVSAQVIGKPLALFDLPGEAAVSSA
ncbi:MAG TPA: metallophosphoesterase [Thermoleophilaceae bacterium]|jgi:Icc-related predicted phosphoesterase